MCPSVVEMRSVTSEIRRRKERKKERKTTAVKHKPFGIAMPCGLNKKKLKTARRSETAELRAMSLKSCQLLHSRTIKNHV